MRVNRVVAAIAVRQDFQDVRLPASADDDSVAVPARGRYAVAELVALLAGVQRVADGAAVPRSSEAGAVAVAWAGCGSCRVTMHTAHRCPAADCRGDGRDNAKLTCRSVCQKRWIGCAVVTPTYRTVGEMHLFRFGSSR